LSDLKVMLRKVCTADPEVLRKFSKNNIVERLRDKRTKISFEEMEMFNKYLDIYSLQESLPAKTKERKA
jgi:hypothetical protein